MLARLLLLFTVVPAVELYLLILIGQWLGAFETVMIILLTGGLGAFLAKREGLGVLRTLQQEALTGIPPGDRIVEGLMVLVGGVLLITPGVLTDLTGFVLIMPWSRRWLAPRVKARLMKSFFSPGPGSSTTWASSVTFGSPRVVHEPHRTSEGGFSHPVPERED